MYLWICVRGTGYLPSTRGWSAPWVAGIVALGMVSSIASFSAESSLKLRRNIRFEAIVVVVAVGAALISAPWQTLSVICLAYLSTLPLSIRSYAKVRRQRAAAIAAPTPAPVP